MQVHIYKVLINLDNFFISFRIPIQYSLECTQQKMKEDKMPKGWRIAVEILFAAFEQKDCNAEPQQMLRHILQPKAPNFQITLLNGDQLNVN